MSAELVCAACGEVLPALSRRSSCPCGGLLDVVQRPREPGRTLRARFDRRLREGDPGVEGSGVWRFRELLLPGRGVVVTHPEGAHAASASRGDRALRGPRRARLEARGPQPHRLLQGPRHDGRRQPREPLRRERRRLRVHGQHLGLDGGLRGAGRAHGAWSSSRRARSPPASSPRPSPTGLGHSLVQRRLRRLPRARARGPRASWASLCSTRSTPGGSRGRRRSSSSCCSSAAGSRRTGSSCRRATSATPPPSARRSREMRALGLIRARCRASRRSRPGARAPSTGATGAALRSATACGPRPSPRPSASATRRATIGRCGRSATRAASSRP